MMLSDRRDMAALIRRSRRRKGLSQEAVADAVGVSRQAVHNWESATSVPTLARADRLSTLLDIPRAKLDLKSATGPSKSALALAEMIDGMVAERFEQMLAGRS